MAVPKKKTTRSARNQRRSHHALSKMTLVSCQECGLKTPSHTVCKNCGTYRGEKITGVGPEAAVKKSVKKTEDKPDKTKEPQKS